MPAMGYPICRRGDYRRDSRCHCGLSEQTGKTTTLLESTICQIIRSAFSEDEPLKLPEGLEPSVVYAELQAQAIPGFALLPGGLLDCADNALATAWLNHDLGRRALFGHLLDVQDEMLSVLEAKGIPTVILKGAAAGMLYPDPGLRSYGDIDFMVSPADFKRARAALVAAGFEGKDDDGVCDHHVGLDKDGVRLELHWEPNGIPQGTPGLKALFQEALGHTEAACVQGHSFPVFPPPWSTASFCCFMRASTWRLGVWASAR